MMNNFEVVEIFARKQSLFPSDFMAKERISQFGTFYFFN